MAIHPFTYPLHLPALPTRQHRFKPAAPAELPE